MTTEITTLTTEEQQIVAMIRGEQWMDVIMLAAGKIPPVESTDENEAEPDTSVREAAYIEILENIEADRREQHMRVSWAIMGALIAALILPEPSRAFAAEDHTLTTGVIYDTLQTWLTE